MSDRPIVFVSGAGGFIGGRIVEVLHTLERADIRAGLRRWSTAARIGRFPVEMVKCDLRNASDVKQALQGITHVVHCAVGDRDSTVNGTRTLLQGALEAGVKRFVHISTIAVYGTPEGTVDEAHPLVPTGDAYGDMKIEAEEVCQEFARQGLHVTILRPTLVHGPFSATWSISYAQRLQARPWLIPETDANGICNLVYVDDLVGAVLAALEADTQTGEAFNVNGPERPSWNQYFRALNDALGLPPLTPESKSRARMSALMMQPVRSFAKFGLKHFEAPIMGLYQRSEFARSIIKRVEGKIRTTPVLGEFADYRRNTDYNTEKAQRVLAYKPRFTLAKSIPLTAEWLMHSGYVSAATRNGNDS